MFANVYRKIQKFAAGGYILYAVLAILCCYVITIYCFFSHFLLSLKYYLLLSVYLIFRKVYCSRMHLKPSHALTVCCIVSYRIASYLIVLSLYDT